MSTSLLLVLVLMATCAHALTSLANIQKPIPGVNAQGLMGQWFCTFRKPPCSYSGSKEFVNIQPFYSVDGKNAITVRLTWGTKYCNNVFGKMVFTPTPGVYMFKDSFGNSISSQMVVIGTDYKTFLCYWGCTKFSVLGDRCDDPYIFVNTRRPRPSKKTIGRINAILMERFGMGINQLDHVLHNGACYSGSGYKKPY